MIVAKKERSSFRGTETTIAFPIEILTAEWTTVPLVLEHVPELGAVLVISAQLAASHVARLGRVRLRPVRGYPTHIVVK